jgi:hypothetical protein
MPKKIETLDFNQDTTDVLNFIRGNKGARATEIRDVLGFKSCTDLRPHLITLTRSGKIKSKGNTRAATWSTVKR